jgi:hypothetical protein
MSPTCTRAWKASGFMRERSPHRIFHKIALI